MSERTYANFSFFVTEKDVDNLPELLSELGDCAPSEFSASYAERGYKDPETDTVSVFVGFGITGQVLPECARQLVEKLHQAGVAGTPELGNVLFTGLAEQFDQEDFIDPNYPGQ